MFARRSAKLAVSAIALAAMLGVATPAAMAVEKPAASVGASARAQALDANPLGASIKKLDPYVTAGSQGWKLDAPAKVLAQVPSADLQKLKTQVDQMNGYVKDGKIPSPKEASGAGLAQTKSAMQSSGKHGYVKMHWYGMEFGLDKYLIGKLSGGLGAVGGASGLAAAMGATGPAAPVVGAVAALLVAEMYVCQHENGWSIMYAVGVPPYGTVVCNPFG